MTNQVVAVKVIHDLFEDLIDCKKILREINLMRLLDSEYVVKLLDIGILGDDDSFDSLYIVMEYVKSDLRQLQSKKQSLTVKQAKRIMYSFLCGLKYLHSAAVLHRDIKPANLLLNRDQVKICDFGLARSLVGVFEDEDLSYKKAVGNAKPLFGRKMSNVEKIQKLATMKLDLKRGSTNTEMLKLDNIDKDLHHENNKKRDSIGSNSSKLGLSRLSFNSTG